MRRALANFFERAPLARDEELVPTPRPDSVSASEGSDSEEEGEEEE
jgi:hypothetical protein